MKDHPLSLATLCSGSESLVLATQAIAEVVEDMGGEFETDHAMSFEKSAAKRGFILDMLPHLKYMLRGLVQVVAGSVEQTTRA